MITTSQGQGRASLSSIYSECSSPQRPVQSSIPSTVASTYLPVQVGHSLMSSSVRGVLYEQSDWEGLRWGPEICI